MSAKDEFDAAERRGVYRAIHTRRDVRSYRPEPVDEAALARILEAAHHAPSVGFMQPWTFVLVRAEDDKRAMYAHFLEVNERAARVHPGERGEKYRALKLQGLLDAPVHVLVVCDGARAGEHVLGRFTTPETDVYSTCLAVQNLWLAARAEGLGVGWMSLFEAPFVRARFGLPEHVVPVAYLTLGHPVVLTETPMLERVGWASRRPLEEVVREGRWDGPTYTGRTGVEPTPASPTSRASGATYDARARLDALTKPVGSLGALEVLAERLATISGGVPRCARATLLLFAADHGLTKQGVSAYLREATQQMVYQYLAQGAVVSAFARAHDVEVRVIDVGVDHDFGDARGLHHAKVRRGTRDIVEGPAMSAEALEAALDAGRRAFVEASPELLVLGEMGIGNTTSASALLARLEGLEVDDVLGRGTGALDETLARKREVIARALAMHTAHEPYEALRCLGGLEIAALVGAIEAAHAARVPVLLDGFITSVAALVAARRDPEVARTLVASHLGAEAAHGRVLSTLGLRPLLDLGLRLGEGSGAVLAVPLVRAAASLFTEVRTYEEANLVRPLDPRNA